MKILVLGSKGQLGSDLMQVLQQHAYDVTGFSHAELDICDHEKLKKIVTTTAPKLIINCTAYTNVDKAETEREQASAVNQHAVTFLAKLCAEKDIILIHFSTDYVFDGNTTKPYKEDATPQPINHYGLSKLLGEEGIRLYHPKHLIIRVSWLFGLHGNNFVKSMINFAQQGKTLSMVEDQWGVPVYTYDLSLDVLKIIKQLEGPAFQSYGTYHYCSADSINRYEYAKAIFATAANFTDVSQASIKPIRSEDYILPAQRPLYCILDASKIAETFKLDIPSWKSGLKHYIKAYFS